MLPFYVYGPISAAATGYARLLADLPFNFDFTPEAQRQSHAKSPAWVKIEVAPAHRPTPACHLQRCAAHEAPDAGPERNRGEYAI
jgi:hypothetical protein